MISFGWVIFTAFLSGAVSFVIGFITGSDATLGSIARRFPEAMDIIADGIERDI